MVQRLPGCHRAFLIALLAVWRTHAGNDEIAVGPELPCGRDFMAGTDNTVQSRAARQFGEALDLIMRRAHDAYVIKIIAIKAGQDRNGDHLGPCARGSRSEEHTYELQSLMRIAYAVFCLKKNNMQQISK